MAGPSSKDRSAGEKGEGGRDGAGENEEGDSDG